MRALILFWLLVLLLGAAALVYWRKSILGSPGNSASTAPAATVAPPAKETKRPHTPLRAKARRAPEQPAATVAPAEPKRAAPANARREPVPPELARSVRNGTQRQDVIARLGQPTLSASSIEDHELQEQFWYRSTGTSPMRVVLREGRVSSVQP